MNSFFTDFFFILQIMPVPLSVYKDSGLFLQIFSSDEAFSYFNL